MGCSSSRCPVIHSKSCDDHKNSTQSEAANHNNCKDIPAEIPPDEETAATKIQSAFRGHLARKEFEELKHQAMEKVEQETKDLEEIAATKIQATFRGHLTRKELHNDGPGAEHWNGNQKHEDVDESDTILDEAATKIQATFRGHLARKHMEED